MNNSDEGKQYDYHYFAYASALNIMFYIETGHRALPEPVMTYWQLGTRGETLLTFK